MCEKYKKRQIAKISVFITSIFVIFMSVTYAFITQTLTGEKQVVINAGVLDLVLEEENAITISDALPMYDEVGMIQDDVFIFRLVNKTANPTNYMLKLSKIESTNELSTSDVKYYLTKEGNGQVALLSSLTDGVIDEGTIEGNDTLDYTLRFWITSEVTSNSSIANKSLSYKLNVEVSQVKAKEKITFAGITEEVEESTVELTSYTNEGCIFDMTTRQQVCGVAKATNGIYSMEDDDGPSYYYRGAANNIVKFGQYEQDYYVYTYDSYEFVSLAACQQHNSSCSEDNKTLKYSAGTPMYWKIIRINGDGTIRMIYSGTTPDALYYETGIGVSRYHQYYTDKKYTGYTIDRTTTEVDSSIKIEVDNWYNTYLANTSYDDKVALGKFCSDSSGFGASETTSGSITVFDAFERNMPVLLKNVENATPTFKCPETSETFGGSYSLKAGLITSDEIVAAGGQYSPNNSYYLYNGTKGNNDGKWFWSMSPAVFNNYATVGGVDSAGYFVDRFITNISGIVRPVINLTADVTFKSGTDGTVLSPYEVE